ncbi:MAG TPA: VacB/RNase II family 3'-5' exoribonuclease, partial [Candidatus Paceibacterota bacterium]|nr:VacB/RNase II family 3'-5' exoribonuclease [Candidatus Paceibacterota bacterium]
MSDIRSEQTFEGPISISTKGVGYLKLKDINETIEIPREGLNRAFHGDTVAVTVTATPQGEYPKGTVTEVKKRAKFGYAATLVAAEGRSFAVSTDARMYVRIEIPEPSLHDAEIGDKVFVGISQWENPLTDPTGEVIRVLGKPLENTAEMHAIALEKGFDNIYPPEVEKESAAIAARGIPLEDFADRRDFRTVTTFTIDPADAKDFDDAISVQFLENELIEVGIHIADVSHYVRTGTALDTEAAERATSVYLVDRTIPMLPEVLSNDLCSLKPDVDRLTFSAIFTFDAAFNIKDSWFGRTIIHSAKRFTYEDAQEVLNSQTGPHLKELNFCLAVSKYLEAKRFEAGAISIDTEEVKFKLDENSVPVGVYKKVRGDTHHLIEELMLLANRKVAEFIATHDKHGNEIFVYRVHDLPAQDRMLELRDFLKRLGHTLPLKDGIIPSFELNKLLKSLAGKPEEDTVQTAIVRSMAKAIYSTKNIGHYGLAFQYYTHFTSPIRRYPDLVVHRLLFEYLSKRTVDKKLWEYYEHISAHASEREKQASDAERASIKYKQVEYMSYRIGKTF